MPPDPLMPDQQKTVGENIAALANILDAWAVFARAVLNNLPADDRARRLPLGILASGLALGAAEARRFCREG